MSLRMPYFFLGKQVLRISRPVRCVIGQLLIIYGLVANACIAGAFHIRLNSTGCGSFHIIVLEIDIPGLPMLFRAPFAIVWRMSAVLFIFHVSRFSTK
jgi:hypothetical protein